MKELKRQANSFSAVSAVKPEGITLFRNQNDETLFSRDLLKRLPPILKSIINEVPIERHKDITLIGLLACSSACFPKAKILESMNEFSLNLMCLVCGPSGTGKSQILLGQKWTSSSLMYLSDCMRKSYSGPQDMITVGTNISASKLIQKLQASEGNGLMVGNEIGQLSKTLESKWGGLILELFLQLADNQTVTSEKLYDEFKAEKGKLSILIAGVEDKYNWLHKHKDDGFNYRVLFYRYGHASVAPRRDSTTQTKPIDFTSYSEQLLKKVEIMNQRSDTSILFTTQQNNLIDEHINSLFEECFETEEKDNISEASRRALIIKRLAALSTLLRVDISLDGEIVVTDEDLEIAIDLVDHFREHMANFINNQEPQDFLTQKDLKILVILKSQLKCDEHFTPKVFHESYLKGIYSLHTFKDSLKVLKKREMIGQYSTRKPYFLPCPIEVKSIDEVMN